MVLNFGWGRLVNYAAMLLVICQFRLIIGYEDWKKLIIRESLSM